MNPVVWLVGDLVWTDIEDLAGIDVDKVDMQETGVMHTMVSEVGGDWLTLKLIE